MGKHLRYQNKENSCLQEPPSPLRGSPDSPDAPAHTPGWLRGPAKGCIPMSLLLRTGTEGTPSKCKQIWFGIYFLKIIIIFLFCLSWQQRTWWICASTCSSCCHPLFVCSMSLSIPALNWAAATHVKTLHSSVFMCLKPPGLWNFGPD